MLDQNPRYREVITLNRFALGTETHADSHVVYSALVNRPFDGFEAKITWPL